MTDYDSYDLYSFITISRRRIEALYEVSSNDVVYLRIRNGFKQHESFVENTPTKRIKPLPYLHRYIYAKDPKVRR